MLLLLLLITGLTWVNKCYLRTLSWIDSVSLSVLRWFITGNVVLLSSLIIRIYTGGTSITFIIVRAIRLLLLFRQFPCLFLRFPVVLQSFLLLFLCFYWGYSLLTIRRLSKTRGCWFRNGSV